MEQLLTYVANYGFPMVITLFLLLRMETKLEQLTNSISELAKVIATKG
ncbi:YvrJ family protein [Anaerospora sp.]|nr:YvrJ family protein [Anaerospora sp.]